MSQVCSSGPLLKVVPPSPAGPSASSQPSTPGCWPARWAATWRTQWSWCCACNGSTTRSWWTRIFSQPATTSPSALSLMGMSYRMTHRSSWSKVVFFCLVGGKKVRSKKGSVKKTLIAQEFNFLLYTLFPLSIGKAMLIVEKKECEIHKPNVPRFCSLLFYSEWMLDWLN